MIALATGIFEAIWRRLFGGWLESVPVFKERWFQHVLNCLVLGGVMFLTGVIWWKIICALAIIEALAWSKGHGAMFEFGHSIPDEKMLERYKKAWGYKIACKIFPEADWYTYWFDAFLMYIRYGLPSVALIPFVGWWVGIAGFVGVAGYQLGWYLQDRGFKFMNNSFCKGATNFGELVTGLALGVTLVI